MNIPEYMDDPAYLEVPDQLAIFARVFLGPATYFDGRPLASVSRKKIQITTPHAIVDLSLEQADALRTWLNEKLGGLDEQTIANPFTLQNGTVIDLDAVPDGSGVCSVCGIIPRRPDGQGCTHP